MAALFDLGGKLALISGASRGIGASIAHTLAAHGAHVALCGRKVQDCEAVAEKIRRAGGQASAYACHTGEPDQIEALFALIRERHQRLDILVNNAATNPYFGPIVEADLGAFQKTFDVNVRGYFLMSQFAARMMLEQRAGSIVNVASVNGIRPGVSRGIYSMTKATVISMTEAFARELAPAGVRVNALLPGATDTRFAAATLQYEATRLKALEHVPMNRIAAPDEMAAAVLYLVSDAASYTTGACLNVDGGYLLV
ncbi:MAG: SDR family oxidoreductase [Desulfovibrionaceae bacterium]|jgi:NAD(P)-dependent dehydrogenase (short-subunit alcohol dehydrogenase family)|nr:SDR family oxidoreductase [Desulfovibrionaceae bacterium]